MSNEQIPYIRPVHYRTYNKKRRSLACYKIIKNYGNLKKRSFVLIHVTNIKIKRTPDCWLRIWRTRLPCWYRWWNRHKFCESNQSCLYRSNFLFIWISRHWRIRISLRIWYWEFRLNYYFFTLQEWLLFIIL